ncbi:MAG TPA: gfo/Idh/MocA family oxidoreductase, partial [Clostridiales bacterium]|nr:gfo/Idh/MocA family oxidoreductase [Clostridiales bacterium]
HLDAWTTNPNVEVIAVCDILRDRAERASQKHGIPHVFEDYKDLIALEELDLVDICTPNKFHSEIAVAALNAGKNVMCEKPDAINNEEVLKMQQAYEKSGKLLMVMRNNRFTAESAFVKKYVQDGKMGEVYYAKCGWVRRRGIPGKGGWFTTKELSGGGPLIDLGVHMMDLTIWLMGNPRPVSVVGSTYSKFGESSTKADTVNATFGDAKADGIYDVEDLATGYVKFDNGATMVIEFSWAENIETEGRYYELMGTKAGAKWHSGYNNGKLSIFGEEQGITTNIEPNFKKSGKREQHAGNLDHVVDCLLGKAEPIFKPQQGVDMIKIISAIYESAETGKEVIL